MKQNIQTTTGLTDHALMSATLRPVMPPRKKLPLPDRNVWDYLHILKRRWKLITLVTAVVFALAAVFVTTLPARYQADVLVVIQAPNVNAGASVVAVPDMMKKLDALREQVESRRTLDQVIKKYDLFAAQRGSIPQEEIHAEMRKSIKLKLGKSSFNIIYEDGSPQTAADVANEIARHYIEENTRLRRDALDKTGIFIASQLARLKRDVNDASRELQDFRYKYQGMLPEDVPANQALLISLSGQATQADTSMDNDRLRKRKAEDRIAELLLAEMAQRQKSIQMLKSALKKMPAKTELGGEKSADAELLDAETGANTASSAQTADEPVDVEIEIQKQHLRQQEITTTNSERNAKDNEELHKLGIVSSIVASRARAEADSAKTELNIARARMLQTRQGLVDKLKTAAAELESLNQFQNHWGEMLVKIQEIEAQRLRISGHSSQEDVADANRRIELLTASLAEMRSAQNDKTRQIGAARELAQQVVEHENIMVGLTRQQKDALAVKTRVADLERRLIASAAVQVQMPELLRKAKLVNDQYEVMLKHKMEADLQMGVEDQQEGERMVIWDAAITPAAPFKPKYAMLLAGGLMGALSLGVLLALLLELAAPKFQNTETLQNHCGMDVLAEIDKLSSRDIPRLPPDIMPPGCANVITLGNPSHRVSRQFMDAACLLFRPQGKWPRVVAVCSPGNGDGKTFVAANLAAALALSTKQPTLLVDANLRAPSLHTLFDKPLESGLAEALEGGPIHVHPLPCADACGLQLLTAGQARQHGTVLLASMRFREMMDKLSYQGAKPHIILDTPPLRSGADVDVLLHGVDGVLLIVRRGHTPISAVARALRRINPDKLLGVIFNDNLAE
jgi:Mrp family chromosome partitioning ATPase/uncharacterized protein involved in exopolysaccharide biosynthesis